jgi:hypothetical protein
MATSQNITSPNTMLPDRRAALRSMLAIRTMAAVPVAASATSSAEDPAFEAIKRYHITQGAYEDASVRNDEARMRARREGREVSDMRELEIAGNEFEAAEQAFGGVVPTTAAGIMAKLDRLAKLDNVVLGVIGPEAIASILRSPHWCSAGV